MFTDTWKGMVVIVKDNVAVSVMNVGMCFNQSQERVDNLKEYLIKFVRRDLKYDEFWALRDVDFQIKKGERLGVPVSYTHLTLPTNSLV